MGWGGGEGRAGRPRCRRPRAVAVLPPSCCGRLLRSGHPRAASVRRPLTRWGGGEGRGGKWWPRVPQRWALVSPRRKRWHSLCCWGGGVAAVGGPVTLGAGWVTTRTGRGRGGGGDRRRRHSPRPLAAVLPCQPTRCFAQVREVQWRGRHPVGAGRRGRLRGRGARGGKALSVSLWFLLEVVVVSGGEVVAVADAPRWSLPPRPRSRRTRRLLGAPPPPPPPCRIGF